MKVVYGKVSEPMCRTQRSCLRLIVIDKFLVNCKLSGGSCISDYGKIDPSSEPNSILQGIETTVQYPQMTDPGVQLTV